MNLPLERVQVIGRQKHTNRQGVPRLTRIFQETYTFSFLSPLQSRKEFRNNVITMHRPFRFHVFQFWNVYHNYISSCSVPKSRTFITQHCVIQKLHKGWRVYEGKAQNDSSLQSFHKANVSLSVPIWITGNGWPLKL